MTQTNLLKDWTTGKDVGIVFEDISKTGMTHDRMDKMLMQFKSISNEYGFDMKMWGLKENYINSLTKEQSKQKCDDGAKAMFELVKKIFEIKGLKGSAMLLDEKLVIDGKIQFPDYNE